jgi:predicted unusual protein kinase regulating ubiquinone biosynthesis (AarF/ABC1/UbiB family)
MSQDKVPVSKIERASKFLKTGAKVGVNYIKHYGQKLVNKDVSDEELDRHNAQDIFEGFAELRGSALKLAQMLSMDSVNLSSTYTNVFQKAQYSVPPMSAPLAVQAFKSAMGKDPEKIFDQFNPNAFKAASMGQVHIAYLNGKKLAVKIQYPGVADSIKSDIKMVRSVAPKLVNASSAELAPFFEEVEERLTEEANYQIELRNSLEFKKACSHIPGLIFPEYYPEFSSNRVLTMDWIEGQHLKEFLTEDPGPAIRQKIANSLWDFYEFQIHELRKLNADPHPGNFLFRPDGSIGVLDFGCTKSLTQELYDDYFSLASPGLFDDAEQANKVLTKLQILRPTDSEERKNYLTDLFSRLITKIAMPYHNGKFYFNDQSFYEELNAISMEISKLREVRGTKDYIFINRTYFGLYALFKELDVEIETACKYKDFLSHK